ncbi:FliA/WhiG subfamily RNA polymerase sigma-28 subunit [Thermincola ferriacetica]|uniref:RNA polymerase sigma factor SigI n=2 Tax=Thermincola TaxID=278993 RepID=D5XEH8_THEPJ|nr:MULTISPECIES: RNA polymerase sigma factor SigI [Thermincola]ADG82049.1 RNA polymerase, sigma 28 subunit, FliA/WhiG subfamily [Thermincola potens JR]KNZ71067.1 FliA/WhiG subfamily RNA polymerase sigma-28 subunit [Thermincola ferriacetica]
MGFLFRNSSDKGESSDYKTLVREAKNGNHFARERLIKRYSPFVLKITSKVCGRFVHMGEDDEVSIGLMAFNEAIDCYDDNKNMSFLSFAETVIKRRLVDYFRKEQQNKNAVPLSSFETEDEDESEGTLYHIEAKRSQEVYQQASLAAERKEEIFIYNQKLQEFGLTFAELVKISPKHEDARVRAIEVAHLISRDEEIKEYLLRKKELPLKTIEQRVDISRKTLERQRKYIIAVALILINDFAHLKQYVEKAV